MRQLERRRRGNPEAREGLRKGIADWMREALHVEHRGGHLGLGQRSYAPTTSRLFMKQNAPALGVIFKPGEVQRA